MKLYEMTLELSALSDNIASLLNNEEMDAQAKELALDGCKAMLDQLAGTHAEKCINVACLIKNIDAEAEAIGAEEKKLSARRKAAEHRAEWLRRYLSGNMEPGTNLKDARAVIGWRKSTAVEVTVKPEELPENLRRTKITVEADKAAIKTNLEAGQAVEGCALVTRFNLQIK
jgi:hypothetical protein